MYYWYCKIQFTRCYMRPKKVGQWTIWNVESKTIKILEPWNNDKISSQKFR